ncbi:MAG: molybdenum cofactor guanylyltransferase [Sphingomonadales bacterium]|nr:molybdenum cofactor guanylyltransferase [Sphingomonadales bacterium]
MPHGSTVTILGAIIAGGRARRFGSDKAIALYNDRRLIDIVIEGLSAQVAAVVVCGRAFPALKTLEDRPDAGLGPLGGLCAALHYANENGYDAVLSVAADVLPIPPSLVDWLSVEPGPTVVRGQHLLGLWPSRLASDIDSHLATTTDRSLRGWIAASGATSVTVPMPFANINTPEDLAHLHSLGSH